MANNQSKGGGKASPGALADSDRQTGKGTAVPAYDKPVHVIRTIVHSGPLHPGGRRK
jgi:hypothetical protein